MIDAYKRLQLFLALCIVSSVASAADATLVLRWSPNAAQRSEKISLIPVDAVLPEGLSTAEAIALWTRDLSASPLRWDALPAGTYRIVLRATTAASDAPPPVELGEIVLAPGEERTVPIVLPESKRDAAQSLRIRTSGVVPATDIVSVTQWRGNVATKLNATVRTAAGGLSITTSAMCVSGSILLVEGEDAIGSARLGSSCEETVSVPLLPKAGIAARITVPDGIELPKSGILQFAACPEIPFTIAGSRLSAAVPVCNGMSLLANGFLPVALKRQTLQAGRTTDFGIVALRPGAAAAFRVRDARTAELLSGVRVQAVRAHDLGSIDKDAEIEAATLATAISDQSGWVRVSGLSEERVVFLLQAPGRRLPQVTEPYAFTPGTETVIDDLLVEPAPSLLVTVSIPDAVAESLRLDKVELRPEGHNHWPAHLPITAPLTPTGAVIADVPSGTWKIEAAGRLENGFAIRVAPTTIEVGAADQPVTLTLSDLLYRGRVKRGGSPVAGWINLKPADRRSGRRTAVAEIAADGTFLVLLEGEGDYVAIVQETQGRSARFNRYIAFRDPDDEVEIELPERRITGQVVDATGAPVPDVGVAANQQIAEPAGMAGARAADGRFVIEGVAPGTWEVVASTKTGQSEPVVVSVGSSDVHNVTLVVEPIRIAKVRLTDGTGAPVRQALVIAEYPQTGALRPKSDARSTSGDGVAEFRVSRRHAGPVNLVLATYDARLSCALRELEADQNVTITPHFGELRLGGRQNVPLGRRWLLSSSGCVVPFLGTRVERDGGDSTVVFPKLAAGTWSYVEIGSPDELASLLTGRATRASAMQTFTVEPGKATRVALPRER